MSGLREQVAFAISHGNLTQNSNVETSADLIGALALSDPLGAALWRVTGNLDAASFRNARTLLLAALFERHPAVPARLLREVCNMALEEWLACLCPTCAGRAFVVSDKGVRGQCPTCKGSGRGRQTDAARMATLRVGNATYSKLVAALDEAHAALNAADRAVAKQIACQLDRKFDIKRVLR